MIDPMDEIDGISFKGFSVPVTVEQLHSGQCDRFPPWETGIYIVLRLMRRNPSFVPKSSGGWFDGKDPSYPMKRVHAKWVEGARVLYVGKAASREGLHGRIDDLVRFGFGEPVGHRGGRLLWHLKDSKRLLVRWRECPAADARDLEIETKAKFATVHGVYPFANLIK